MSVVQAQDIFSSGGPSTLMKTLEIFPQIAANSCIGFAKTCTLEEYKSFVNAMYHYTLPSEELLGLAATKMPNDELREFFEHQSKEERGHYRMAKDDLVKGFSEEVSEITPPAVQEYIDFWKGLEPDQALAYLGAVYVFENVAQLADNNASDMVQRLGLEKRQATWLLVHLHADIEHGEEATELAHKYMDQAGEQIIYGAAMGCKLWVRIFQEAFITR